MKIEFRKAIKSDLQLLGEMKSITIIRHGKPQAHHIYKMWTVLKGSDIKTFIDDWNTCELSLDNSISEELRAAVSLPECFVSSQLKRTHDSFRLLGINKFYTSELLNEAEFPNGFWKNLKMPFALWGLVIRFMWLFGLEKNAESHKDFKKRAKKAYFYLESLFGQNSHICVMGHGLMNSKLKNELKRNGWNHIMNSGGHGYWSFDILETAPAPATRVSG